MQYARMNPKDYRSWLNGICLNPKCSFRSLPLDGLLETQATTLTSQFVTPLAPHVPTSHVSAPHVPAFMSLHLMFLIALREKQLVPYIFFQKGLCLKGDRCAFLHGPNPTRNKIPQVPIAAPDTEPPSLKKVFGGPENHTQE